MFLTTCDRWRNFEAGNSWIRTSSLSSIRTWNRHGSCVSFRNHGLFGNNGTSDVGGGFDGCDGFDGFDGFDGPCREGGAGAVGGHLL